VDDLRKFKLDPSRGPVPNTELIPPPLLTNHPLPFNWAYHQNPTIKTYQNPATGAKTLLNHSLPAKLGTLYLAPSVPSVPTGPPRNPPGDPLLLKLITDLNQALELRPIWTRRALTNQLASSPGLYLLKSAVQYVGYQFRGGPWRDAIIKYGIDPRTDPQYRIYQTVFFKIFDESEKVPGAPWVDIRSEYSRKTPADEGGNMSHIFDGKRISLDGKVWQICDITDPLLCNLAATASLRRECDIESDGWYTNGTWAKIKAIMRTKISAIRAGREMDDEEFEETLKYPDSVVDKTKPGMPRTKLAVPVPDWRQKGGPVRKGPPDNGRRKRRGGGKLKGAALGVGSRRKWKDVKIGVGSGANDSPVAQSRVGDLASLPGLRRPGAGSMDLDGAVEMGRPESSVYGGENVASSAYGGENLASSAYGGNEYDEDEDAEGEVYDEDEIGEGYDEDYDNQYGFGPREHEYGSDGLEG
jgi:general transcription factor 3C polypeptide 5 (transcription factor C subunit 1)